jgi:hypothetical protein
MKKILIFLFLAATLSACQESLENRCAREAREYTQKKCPAPIGNGVTIDSMEFDKASHTICYYYSLSGKVDDQKVVDNSRQKIYTMLLKAINNAPDMKAYKNKGYSFKYTYSSTKDQGKILFQHVYTKKEYK